MSESIAGLEAVVPLPVDDTQLEAQIPKPVGYHILVAMPEVTNTFGD
jgi:hypothetical protein